MQRKTDKKLNNIINVLQILLLENNIFPPDIMIRDVIYAILDENQ